MKHYSKSVKQSQGADIAGIAADFIKKMGVKTDEKLPLPDLWEFLTKCCFTFDERAKEIGERDIRPFPAKPHLKNLTREYQANNFLAVDKSSQIMVTHWLAGVTLWQVLKFPAQRIAWFCLKRPLAVDHLKSRVLRMYQMIPSQYAKPFANVVQGEFLVFHDGPDKLPTSRIVPMAAETDASDDAARQMRSETWTAAVEDESAFYRNGEELHFSLLPRTGRLTKVSTPNGWSFFTRLMYASDLNNATALEVAPQKEELARGVRAWYRHGFRCVEINYRADPDKDPETPTGQAWYNAPAQAAMRQNSRKWQREWENDHTVPAGEPVYANSERIVVKQQLYDARLKLFRGWDFGFHTPVCILVQIELMLDSTGKPVRKIVHALKEIVGSNTPIGNFAENEVLPYMQQVFPRVTYANQNLEDFGDPAGNAKEGTSGESAIRVLASLGILVKSCHARLEQSNRNQEAGRIDVLQAIISAGDLEIDPQGCPGLLADLKGAYHRDDFGKIVKDNEHDHRPDSLGYVIANLFIFGTSYTGPRTVSTQVQPYQNKQPLPLQGQISTEKGFNPNILPKAPWYPKPGPGSQYRDMSYTPKRQWDLKKLR